MSFFTVEADGRVSIDEILFPTREEASEIKRFVGQLLQSGHGPKLGRVLREFSLDVLALDAVVEERDFSTMTEEGLVATGYRVALVRKAATEAGGEIRLILALLIFGNAARRGNRPALLAHWFLLRASAAQAEGERRAALYPVSASVATLAAAMREDEQGPHAEQAALELETEVARAIKRLPKRARRRVSKAEAGGQAVLTTHEATDSAKPVLELMARAMRGEYDKVPSSAATKLDTAARTLERRSMKSVGMDFHLPGGPTPEQELRSFELEIDARATLGAADTAERSGRSWQARRLRKELYERLGGKKQ